MIGERETSVERAYLLQTLSGYWPGRSGAVAALPIPEAPAVNVEPLPPKGVDIRLPDWAVLAGVGGCLRIPERFVCPGEGPRWTRVDWWGSAFWYLGGLAERAYEDRHGPVHSYAFRLKGWDGQFWERAWVNRIARFLSLWAAKEQGVPASPIPLGRVHLTHDVDAVEKTIAIRLKQASFHLLNAVRLALAGRMKEAFKISLRAFRFFFGNDDYWRFKEIMKLEKEHRQVSRFHFYGGLGKRARNLKERFFDPAYCVSEKRFRPLLKGLLNGGWTVGLHPAYGSWQDSGRMREEKERLEKALGGSISASRQHWLRFSWADTWRALQDAGVRLDTTLGFNDRPGFRGGCALRYSPWDPQTNAPLEIEAVPMVFMDSHFYDYGILSDSPCAERIKYWVEEVLTVGGEASVIWHQRVMSVDYGWGAGYRALLELLEEPGKPPPASPECHD
jgi:hypothetical protein